MVLSSDNIATNQGWDGSGSASDESKDKKKKAVNIWKWQLKLTVANSAKMTTAIVDVVCYCCLMLLLVL